MKEVALILGVMVGVILGKLLPNPFFWIEEKWQRHKDVRRSKQHYEELRNYGISEKTARHISRWTK